MQVRTEEGAAHEEYVSVWGRVGRLLRVLAFQVSHAITQERERKVM